MPGLVRKLVIFAIADGLILQTTGNHLEQPQALRLEWKTAKLTPWKSTATEQYKNGPHVESHGIVGLLSVASYSFLISISRREQVAQILGKPIYVIKDVSIFPLSSKADAEKALIHANASALPKTDSDSDPDSSDNESINYESLEEPEEPTTTGEGVKPPEHSRTVSSIAEDVIGRKGQYGRFAAQWFSRAGWSQEKKRTMGLSTDTSAHHEVKAEEIPSDLDLSAVKSQPSATEPVVPIDESRSTPQPVLTPFSMMSKLLGTTRTLLSSSCFYFSYDVNITHRLGAPNSLWTKPPTRDTVDPLFYWNYYLSSSFAEAGQSNFSVPIMQGFVGQKEFEVQRSNKRPGHTRAVESLEKILLADGKSNKDASRRMSKPEPQSFLLTVISRRSVKRSGLRYLRRGVDDEGNTANTVETEQILSSPAWEDSMPIRSFLQIRGSIPLYFSQSPYAFKPIPVMHQSQEANDASFRLHFEDLRRKYGDIQIVVLVDKHGTEVGIGQDYQRYTERFNEERSDKLEFEWFDFHTECRGMKFENVQRLVSGMEKTLTSQGETVIKDKIVIQKQTGIIRTNCMDCLDRTNVVESAFAQHVLEKDLREQGFEIDFQLDPSTQWFNSLWADNGDAISRQYAGTAALKGDFTRTRKRNVTGALNDFSLTLSRYYINIVNDYFSQTVIDYLLGYVSIQAFEDFEANMMSTDPGVSVERIRQKAIDTCTKLVIQDEGEDLLQGWAVLSPKITNTLRTLPFDESVLLLTDRAIYNCKFDWNTEKVISFERIDLKSVMKVQFGAYVTSTLTEMQLDESRNLGIVVTYNPSKDSIIRVNTRSLQNSIDPAETKPADTPVEGSSFFKFGWGGEQTRFMAIKMIASRSPASSTSGDSLITQVEQVAEEIQRAVRNASIATPSEVEQMAVEQAPIISAADAKWNTGYLEHLGHQVKKLVWG